MPADWSRIAGAAALRLERERDNGVAGHLMLRDGIAVPGGEARIAQAAAEMVQPGQTIAPSGGTTTTEVVRYLSWCGASRS